MRTQFHWVAHEEQTQKREFSAPIQPPTIEVTGARMRADLVWRSPLEVAILPKPIVDGIRYLAAAHTDLH
jgi:hypothetical protein